jgi:hypothetical protein
MRNANREGILDELVYAGLPSWIGGDARERLRALLVTQLALRNTTTLRRVLVHGLAVIGGLLILAWLAPEPLALESLRVLASTWWACGCAAALSAIVERRLRADAGRLLIGRRPR